ncbi:membrane protein [Vibrio phage D485]
MIELHILIALFAVHFIADFFVQTEHQALNKSKNMWPLVRHCITYGLCFLPFGAVFAILTGMLHIVVDYATSRMTSKLWAKGETRKFFQVIGLDQFLHAISLVTVYVILQ